MTKREEALLEKLKALAERGIDGEKETAQRKLDEFLKKHGIDEGGKKKESKKEPSPRPDFRTMKTYWLKLEEQSLEPLLLMIVTHVLGYNRAKWINYEDHSLSGRRYAVYCTHAEYAQITEMLVVYTQLWQREFEILLRAFIKKHKLFDPDRVGGDVDEDLERAAEQMAKDMEENHFNHNQYDRGQ